MGKLLLSIQGGRVTRYLFVKKPSGFIPFKGKFPILEEYQQTALYKELQEHTYLEECSDWVQEAILKAEQIWVIDTNFQNYLRDGGLLEKFSKMDAADKSSILIKWMDANSLGIERLNIR